MNISSTPGPGIEGSGCCLAWLVKHPQGFHTLLTTSFLFYMLISWSQSPLKTLGYTSLCFNNGAFSQKHNLSESVDLGWSVLTFRTSVLRSVHLSSSLSLYFSSAPIPPPFSLLIFHCLFPNNNW